MSCVLVDHASCEKLCQNLYENMQESSVNINLLVGKHDLCDYSDGYIMYYRGARTRGIYGIVTYCHIIQVKYKHIENFVNQSETNMLHSVSRLMNNPMPK